MTPRPFAPVPDLATIALAQTSITRCTRCDWQHHGTILEGRNAHVDHRLQAHGIKEAHRRHAYKPRRKWGTQVGHVELETNIAGARLQGAATWANGDAA